MDIKGARIAVQGFGNVGGVAARLFAEAGARVVAVQDHQSAPSYAEAGLDVLALQEHVKEHGGVGGFAGGEHISDRDRSGASIATS